MSTQVEPGVAPPPGNPRFPLFDGLRAIAALCVVVYHAAFYSGSFGGSLAGPVLSRLNIGVTIFFVVSGFLLYRPFAAARYEERPAPGVRAYAVRRLLRIVPAYWVALTILAVYPGLRGLWEDAPVYYGFAQVYSVDTVLNGISPAWTLGTELAFYAVLPLYAVVAGRLLRGRRGAMGLELGLLAALALASTAARVLSFGGYHGTLAVTLAGTFAWFAVGMALAVLSAGGARLPSWAVRALPAWLAAIVAYGVMCAILGRPGGYVFTSNPGYGGALAEYVLSGVVAALLVLPAAFGPAGEGVPRRLLATRPVAWIGLVSYGIYLWHFDVIVWLVNHDVLTTFHVAPFPALTAIALAIVIPIAAISYYGVERPLLRLKPGLRGSPVSAAARPRSAPAAAPAAGAARGGPGGPSPS